MSSSKEYLKYILEQLAPLEEIAYRPMMGEYILYYQGKVVGGIYDDRLLPICRRRPESCPMTVQRKCCWWRTWTIRHF